MQDIWGRDIKACFLICKILFQAFKNNSQKESIYDHFHEMEPYGGLIFSGVAIVGIGTFILTNAYRDYASRKKEYCLSSHAEAIDKPTYWGSLKRELSKLKRILSSEEPGNFP
jgi:hypothetical protein